MRDYLNLALLRYLKLCFSKSTNSVVPESEAKKRRTKKSKVDSEFERSSKN